MNKKLEKQMHTVIAMGEALFSPLCIHSISEASQHSQKVTFTEILSSLGFPMLLSTYDVPAISGTGNSKTKCERGTEGI